MIFLKKLEVFGFKSFAEPLTINFENEMVGIVGPNGSGKSNINDAIRWCLGEQSLKFLRGSSGEDVIFNGSASKPALNMAEVKLTFNNASNIFKTDFEEVEITRRAFRGTGENEYFINKQRVRLKDVQDFALDTGLTKSSLAIISQGQINSFAEAKPIDRRALFEEAAGVAKYKRKKLESLRKLERSQENLVRIKDILNEIERKLPYLKTQRNKALKYKEKKEKLEKIEIAILVKDISFFNEKLSELQTKLQHNEEQKSEVNRKLSSMQQEYSLMLSETQTLESKIRKWSEKYQQIINDISNLKIQKIELDNKENALKMASNEFTTSEMQREYGEIKNKIQVESNKIKYLIENEKEYKSQKAQLDQELNSLNENLGVINKTIIRLESKLEQAKEQLSNKDHLHEGVRNILNNKNVLPGIHGIVQDVVNVNEEYEIALSVALSGRLQDIIVKNTAAAKQAIGYLKQNKAGHATFIPLDIIQPRYIHEDEQFIIKSVDGYIDLAYRLVKYKKEYQKAIEYLLSRYIVCRDFDSAQEVAKLTHYKYSVITLDGEIIRPQGAISGGNRSKRQLTINPEKEVLKIEQDISLKNTEYNELSNNIFRIKSKIDELNQIISESQVAIGSAKRELEILNEEKDKIKVQYEVLTSKSIESNSENNEDEQIVTLLDKINSLEKEKFDIEQELNVSRNIKEQLNNKLQKTNDILSEQRIYLNNIVEHTNKLSKDIVMLETKLQQDLERLSQEYQMTYDYAKTLNIVNDQDEEMLREEIRELRSELTRIGNVNLDSIVEFEEEDARYSLLKKEYTDTHLAIDNLLKSIRETDELMIDQFSKTIKDVNLHLPKTFETLFGGGTAKIIYTEPDNLLETGIEIKIAPPGKNINNLNLLSGGEKSLVALSVLFAILKARPLPLVILDEAEAPLDPANVERFAKYIKTFTDITQFIIVTHRVGTMANCDILYGATMQQKGVTKIVGIKLKQAKELLENQQQII